MEDEPKKFSELAKEKAARVTQHVKDNKKEYIIGTVVGVGCFAAGYLTRGKVSPDVIQTFTDSRNNIGTVINRSKNVEVVIKYLNARNYNAKPVRCLETRQEFPSQEEACEFFNMAASIMSQHLSGKFENAKGFHFERIKSAV